MTAEKTSEVVIDQTGVTIINGGWAIKAADWEKSMRATEPSMDLSRIEQDMEALVAEYPADESALPIGMGWVSFDVDELIVKLVKFKESKI
ncbi:MAG: hypothetical protein LC798_11235 [Chloroflexi bacterium]|nr:hypothetical protein [Chloroflexota bacterium]